MLLRVQSNAVAWPGQLTTTHAHSGRRVKRCSHAVNLHVPREGIIMTMHCELRSHGACTDPAGHAIWNCRYWLVVSTCDVAGTVKYYRAFSVPRDAVLGCCVIAGLTQTPCLARALPYYRSYAAPSKLDLIARSQPYYRAYAATGYNAAIFQGLQRVPVLGCAVTQPYCRAYAVTLHRTQPPRGFERCHSQC